VAETRPTAVARPAAPRAGAARRTPVTAINYAYLRHDLTLLGILGPAMIVLLIVAFFVFHGA
jgi:hypothetical protein